MKELTQEEINEILKEHKHWLAEDCKGWEYMGEDNVVRTELQREESKN